MQGKQTYQLDYSHNQGFTLLELVISLAIMALFLLLVVPSFRTSLQNRRLAQAGQNLYQDILLARSLAAEKQIPVYVSLQSGSNWCYGLNDNAACNCNVSSNCKVNGTPKSVSSSSFSGISLDTSAFTGSSIYFETVRGIPSSTGTLMLSNGSKNLNIVVNSTGYVKLCSSNLDGYPTCT